MTVYVCAHITIHDREEYDKYQAGFMGVFAKFSGQLLSVDEAPTLLEGSFDATRFVLISFPSKEDADAWYNSPEYQQLAKHRFAASITNSIIAAELDPALLAG